MFLQYWKIQIYPPSKDGCHPHIAALRENSQALFSWFQDSRSLKWIHLSWCGFQLNLSSLSESRYFFPIKFLTTVNWISTWRCFRVYENIWIGKRFWYFPLRFGILQNLPLWVCTWQNIYKYYWKESELRCLTKISPFKVFLIYWDLQYWSSSLYFPPFQKQIFIGIACNLFKLRECITWYSQGSQILQIFKLGWKTPK